MSTVWPSSDLFDLMEGLKIIDVCGESFRLSLGFKNFIDGLDSQKLNRFVAEMIDEGFFPEPETEEARWVYFFMVVMELWDPSLPEDENEAAAIFLSAMSWALEVGELRPLWRIE